ncbi:acyl-CoA dehydrogenase [Pseudonocardia sp. EC080610-09]|uniref:acyl-CoA dehydrogenase family protein n=1 Tax=unclassified Pseudonocardia TaxID=2619320 RepID=UPI0006CB37F1|nr:MULTISPECIES: acyl-CoA dehydrogenase family protein [unclassified Pseudonocardia]ALE73340.1 acyl-CoA dehydrogenase [Pseudonocardia sp. EC080625-04]ALL76676.1 acyl-CoA dehydrogenase [Pseudonocardia sp. EC080610-09]ALL83704.1 acyl-CoA dehydrogenase [Pseudonocardia sp. EC080619-01]
MDFRESPEHRDLRDTVRAIAAEFGPEYYVPRAEAGEPTSELWAKLGSSGFLGINLPEEYGGGGAGLVELAMVCEETAAAGCPQLLLLVSAAISGEMIADFGTPEQKAHYLPRMASGEAKVVFAITEPDAGSNTHRLSTVARRDGADWVVNGTKHYISGVDEAEAILLVARSGVDENTGKGKLSLFLVPTDAPGLVRTPLPVSAKLPEKQFVLHFDDLRLPAEALLGEEHKGFQQVFHGLNPERITGAAVCVGVARHVLGRAAEYATTRTVWDVPIGSHQGVAHPLAKARIETDLAALMTSKAAWLHDGGLPAGEASNVAKYAAAEAAGAAVEAAIQTHGGNGLATEYGLLPYWGISRLLRIAPVSREMVLNFVAQHSLGLTRSY